MDIGGWCFPQPIEQGLQDLVDPVHCFGVSAGFFRLLLMDQPTLASDSRAPTSSVICSVEATPRAMRKPPAAVRPWRMRDAMLGFIF